MRRFEYIIAAVAVCFVVCGAQAGTIYVDVDNAGTEDGGSWATAYNTLEEGVTALETSNSVSRGGHLVLVATGTYAIATEADQTLNTLASGTYAAPNTFEAVGEVHVDNVNAWYMSGGTSNVTVDGFIFDAGYWAFQIAGTSSNIVIRNCVIMNAMVGMYISGQTLMSVSNCVFYANANEHVRWSCYGIGAASTFKNCIFANGVVGFRNANTAPQISYCLFYGNGLGVLGSGNYKDGSTVFQTQDEIEAQANCSNIIVGNPGFSDLANNWNFSSFYANSPCLTGGEGGQKMGVTQSPATEPIGAGVTYYVATTGDDGSADPTSPSTPWLTLSKAADTARAGDTVVVQAGSFPQEQVTITNGGSYNTPLVFRASGAVTLDGVSHCFKLDRVAGVVIDGFTLTACSRGLDLYSAYANTFTNITTTTSYGIYMTGSTSYGSGHANKIVDCTFRNGSTGIYSLNSSGANWFEGCSIHDNVSYGAYIATQSFLNRIHRCRFYNNLEGIRVYATTIDHFCAYIQNCMIYTNTTVGLHSPPANYNSMRVENSTIYGNGSWGVVHGRDSSAPAPEIVNSIIAGNNGGAAEKWATGSGANYDMYLINCLFHDNGGPGGTNHNFYNVNLGNIWDDVGDLDDNEEGCTNNISGDPLLYDAANGDFRIGNGSPCIDQGVTLGLTTDFYGGVRPKMTAFDIGAHEWVPPAGTLFVIR